MASNELYTRWANQLSYVAIRIERLRLIYNGTEINHGPGTASDQMIQLMEDVRDIRDDIDNA